MTFVEQVESRRLFESSPFAASVAGSVLTVQINYPVDSGVEITGVATTGRIVIDGTIGRAPSGHRSTFPADPIKSIRVVGDDRGNWIELRNLAVKQITIESRSGDDQIYAREAFAGYARMPMRVLAGAGNDWVETADGHDVIYAGAGNDNCRASEGNDQLFGEAGTDALHGGYGSDTFVGGDGGDAIFGVSVDHHLWAEAYGWAPDTGTDVVYYQVGGSTDNEYDIELRYPVLELPSIFP